MTSLLITLHWKHIYIMCGDNLLPFILLHNIPQEESNVVHWESRGVFSVVDGQKLRYAMHSCTVFF